MYKTFLLVALCSLSFISCNNSNNNMNTDKAEYSGKDFSGVAYITRNDSTKEATFHFEDNAEWTLYGGTSVDNIDFSNALAQGQGRGTYPLNVDDSVRYYFQLVTPDGKAILSERHLPMEGGYNFRDMGGIKTSDGKYVKWGKMFRSDDLHHLTENDLTYLSSIPLVSVVDFRSGQEIQAAADRQPMSVIRDYAYSISPGNIMGAVRSMNLNDIQPARMDTLMMEMNRLLVTDTAAIQQYQKFFELVQNENDIPLIFHCSAGKDRTGMAAALFLYSLGVDEDRIMDDYLMSNRYLADKYSTYIAQMPNLKPLFEVKPEFLRAGIKQIEKDHGTVENYLRNILNVDIDKMREMYLY